MLVIWRSVILLFLNRLPFAQFGGWRCFLAAFEFEQGDGLRRDSDIKTMMHWEREVCRQILCWRPTHWRFGDYFCVYGAKWRILGRKTRAVNDSLFISWSSFAFSVCCQEFCLPYFYLPGLVSFFLSLFFLFLNTL